MDIPRGEGRLLAKSVDRVLTIIQAVLCKIDWRIMVMAAVGFSALNLDRSNINQANSTSFLSDLHLTTNGDSGQPSTFRKVFNELINSWMRL